MSEHIQCHCCPSCPTEPQTAAQWDISRRAFLAMGGVFLGGLSFSALQGSLLAAEDDAAPMAMPTPRKPLIVKPILVHDLPQRRDQSSWRAWGGVQTPEAAVEEVARIKSELAGLQAKADYPVEFLDVSSVTHINQMKDNPDIEKCDTILLYGAGGGVNGVQNFGKDVVIFQRWKSGPVYLQYEIVSPRFLRQHTDVSAIPNIKDEDVVTDKLDEIDWRLRALCGLKNSKGGKIITIDGASSWAHGARGEQRTWLPEVVSKLWGLEYHDMPMNELGKLVEEAMADEKTMVRAKKRADAYLKIPGTKLETTMEFFVNNFVLDDVFRMLMKRVGTNMITIASCMGGIMPKAKTSACMTLCTLNDDGYMAFCESDFAVIPSGILLGNISGKPVFLNDPTYPNDSIITLAHCTGPRKMDGKNYDPVRIVTHFESDYGAAPHVEVPLGTVTTNIAPDFKSERWVGLKGTIVEVPFRPICRTQFDIKYECSDKLLAERMPGFHWMTCYGDYRREVGYALRRIGIQWENLDEVPTKTMS